MSKSVAVLGLGRYGSSLANSLYEMGAEVMVVDGDKDLIQDFSDKSTVAMVADLANEDDVKELGLSNMDVVVVTMGSDLQASIMCVMVAKEQGVPFVIAKAASERMAKVLKRVGADQIAMPEKESGFRLARILTSNSFLEFFSIDEDLCLIKMKPKEKWLGKSLKELNLRKKYRINVVSGTNQNGKWSSIDPEQPLIEEMDLLVVAEQEDLKKLQ